MIKILKYICLNIFLFLDFSLIHLKFININQKNIDKKTIIINESELNISNDKELE